jgi:hypothetical protein
LTAEGIEGCFFVAGVRGAVKKGFCEFLAGRAFRDGAIGIAIDSEL